jgi:hypothetical protein
MTWQTAFFTRYEPAKCACSISSAAKTHFDIFVTSFLRHHVAAKHNSVWSEAALNANEPNYWLILTIYIDYLFSVNGPYSSGPPRFPELL